MSECVLSGHGETARREAEVGLVCLWHRNRMTATTAAIRELWLDLSLILEAGSAPKDETPKTRHLKSAEAPAPANLEALALRDPRSSTVVFPDLDESNPIPPVLTVVASWLLCVAEERPLSAALPRSVVAQLTLLQRHHDWIAAQLWIDDYVAEMESLRKALRLAVRDVTHKQVGRCRLPTESSERCGGSLIEENGTGVIRCKACTAQWTTPQELARLSVTLESA